MLKSLKSKVAAPFFDFYGGLVVILRWGCGLSKELKSIILDRESRLRLYLYISVILSDF